MQPNTNSHTARTKSSKPTTSKTATNTITSMTQVSSANQTSLAKPQPTVDHLNKSARNKPSATGNVVQDSDSGASQHQQENPANANIGVNKKKQKRRQKQAARLAAGQSQPTSLVAQEPADRSDTANTDRYQVSSGNRPPQANGFEHGTSDYDDSGQYEPADVDDLYYTDEEGRLYHDQDPYLAPTTNGHASDGNTPGISNKAKKKKRNKSTSASQMPYQPDQPTNTSAQLSNFKSYPPPPPPPPLSTAALRSAHHISKDRIWNTSTAEERERIKDFWLSLSEEERRSLVKVEKEAVLKKMKEQQKHSCSCTVCGRKRTAIEEELEVLYDAYYKELEQYANHQHINLEDGTPILPHPRLYAHPMAPMPPSRNVPQPNNSRLSNGRIKELDADGDEVDEDGYSDPEEDDELSEEPEELPPGPAADFFNFGNSLTVQGGILTVADDLLKNDGKKFIEMMEQLAERRMQREEEAQYAAAGLGHPSLQPHNHGPPLDDDGGYNEEDDEEYDSQEDEEYDDDEMETLTVEQRMEEGRRMFQIFAARMFEQRVLTAYREKVAAERQQKLIEELEEEDRRDTQREAKKAKEAQKKKDKKRQQKQVKEEEKARREAEKAAEEATIKAQEEKKAEEQRERKEEQRKKREAEKKAQDEERQKKEAEKQKRLQEAKEQQAELERKQREQKEREKKKRDEIRKKEREEREAKEKEAKQKKDRDLQEKKVRDTKPKPQTEMKARSTREAHAVKQAVPPPKTSPLKAPILSTVPIPPALNVPQASSVHVSPHLQIATPAVPKAPTTIRQRPTSLHGSHNSSPKISQVLSASSATSPSLSSLQQNGSTAAPAKMSSQPSPQPPNLGANFPTLNNSPVMVSQPPGLPNIPAVTGHSYASGQSSAMPPMPNRAQPHDPIMHTPYPQQFHQPQLNSNPYQPFVHSNGMPFAPGINGMRHLQHARGPVDPSPQLPPIPPTTSSSNTSTILSRDAMRTHSHSRNSSASFGQPEVSKAAVQAQPIARPTPIHRPSSVTPAQQAEHQSSTATDVDELSNHLGSSALLEDTDIPLSSNNDVYRGSMAPGAPLGARHGFSASIFPDPHAANKSEAFSRGLPGAAGPTWGAPSMPFSSPGMPTAPNWSATPVSGWSNFGVIGGPNRANAPRAVMIRLSVCQACNKLTTNPPLSSQNGFHNAEVLLRQVQAMRPGNEMPVSLHEMLAICDTGGNSQNGGGSFIIDPREPKGTFIKFEPGHNVPGNVRAVPGEIGSPTTAFLMSSHSGAKPSQQPGVMSPSGF